MGVKVGVGVGVGDGVKVGVGVAVKAAVAVAVGICVGVGEKVAAGVGETVGAAVGTTVGDGDRVAAVAGVGKDRTAADPDSPPSQNPQTASVKTEATATALTIATMN